MTEVSRIADEILRQTEAAGAQKSICPSEVARSLAEDWRPLMPEVRRAAIHLAGTGGIEILRKGKRLTADELAAGIKGVIRIRILQNRS